MSPEIVVCLALGLGAGYLIGSIPFGLLLTRAAGLGDIRAIGSGNIGATNVLRTGNKWLAAATLALDALKGWAAVQVAIMITAVAILSGLGGSTQGPPNGIGAYLLSTLPIIGGLGAFLGHLFPIWLKFKGGKGVATFIGVVTTLVWPAGVLFCLTWLLVAWLTRYSSVAALGASILVPPVIWLIGGGIEMTAVAALMSALLIWKHSDNIKRLRAGTESRIGAKG